jgi:hypothetical protein
LVRALLVKLRTAGDPIREYVPDSLEELYTLYPVISILPLSDGRFQVKRTWTLPGAATKFVGALGTTGMTAPITNPKKLPPGGGKLEAA